MKKLIIISDWVDDMMNCQEVRTAVEGYLKDPTAANIHFVSSSPSTIETAFIISQLVEIEERYGRPQETIIFQNTDPRMQSTEGVELSKGADFIIVLLKSGIYLCGPNAGFDFSLIKPQIAEVYTYPGLDKGSQFRSRDLYARVCAHLMDNMEDELDLEETHSNIIPALQGFHVGHIDNHGNMKTTITLENLKGKYEYGQKVKVKIGAITKEIMFADNLFGYKPDELVIYPGSSGKKDNPYIEITVWRHFTSGERTTGAREFNDPLPGAKIELP